MYNSWFPYELHLQIFLCLDHYSLLAASQVCSFWNRMINDMDEILWKGTCENLWNVDGNQLELASHSWKMAWVTTSPENLLLAKRDVLQFKRDSLDILEFNRGIRKNSMFTLSYSLGVLPSLLFSLVNLHTLSLWENRLSKLPSSITKLSQLRVLYLSTNQFQTFPLEICSLSKLQQLDISCNLIQTVPSLISQLHNLEYFFIQYNKVSFLPLQIVCLKKLMGLDLSGNQLSSLLSQLCELPRLRWINVTDNENITIPKQIVQRTDLDLYSNAAIIS